MKAKREEPERPPPGQTPFERFTEFARRIIAVPKSEVAEREREYREGRAAGRTRTPRSP